MKAFLQYRMINWTVLGSLLLAVLAPDPRLDNVAWVILWLFVAVTWFSTLLVIGMVGNLRGSKLERHADALATLRRIIKPRHWLVRVLGRIERIGIMVLAAYSGFVVAAVLYGAGYFLALLFLGVAQNAVELYEATHPELQPAAEVA